jgi:hypothetical protein
MPVGATFLGCGHSNRRSTHRMSWHWQAVGNSDTSFSSGQVCCNSIRVKTFFTLFIHFIRFLSCLNRETRPSYFPFGNVWAIRLVSKHVELRILSPDPNRPCMIWRHSATHQRTCRRSWSPYWSVWQWNGAFVWVEDRWWGLDSTIMMLKVRRAVKLSACTACVLPVDHWGAFECPMLNACWKLLRALSFKYSSKLSSTPCQSSQSRESWVIGMKYALRNQRACRFWTSCLPNRMRITDEMQCLPD